MRFRETIPGKRRHHQRRADERQPAEQTEVIARLEPAEKTEVIERLVQPAERAPVAPPPVDAELLAIFIEEAREEIERIRQLFPLWAENDGDRESLVRVRRAFHTLKGSGRMVGARRVSEFSWSVESMLNRVISQTLPRLPEIVAVVRDAVAASVTNRMPAARLRDRSIVIGPTWP